MPSSECPDLDIDVGECRGIVWAGKCAEALNDDNTLDGMRKFVRKYKRHDGDYDELFESLAKAAGISDDEDEKAKL